MLNEALSFLLNTLLQPFVAVLLLRFHLQWLRAPMRNPLGEFMMAISNFLVLPARRIIPSAWGWDVATLLLAFLMEAIYLMATLWNQGALLANFSILGLVVWTAVKLLKVSVYLLVGAIFVQALLSWFNPHTPVAGLLTAATRPFLMPFRRHLPPTGGIDLSALLVFVVCQLILIVPLAWLETVAERLL